MENKKQFDAKMDQLLINVYTKRLMNIDYLLNEEIKKKQPGDSNLLQVINRDAEWLNQTEKNQRLLQLQVLVESILSNPELMEQEKIKAKERNMTIDQIIKEDAKWLYSRH